MMLGGLHEPVWGWVECVGLHEAMWGLGGVGGYTRLCVG